MKVIYAVEEFGEPTDGAIFLAGPTPRSADVPSWRPEALKYLVQYKYKGTVFVPEPRDGKWAEDYVDQIDWEDKALIHCGNVGAIAMWVPRDLKTMPGFTTNIEFGMYLSKGCLFYGHPPDAPKTRYLDVMYARKTEHGRIHGPCASLEDLIQTVIPHADYSKRGPRR